MLAVVLTSARMLGWHYVPAGRNASMAERLPDMPLLSCQPNELTAYNAEAREWQCALPRSTPHYLADQRRWVLCPVDWILTRSAFTRRHRWIAPEASPR
jgi:hypothetical protein